jgi:hypothetical protein
LPSVNAATRQSIALDSVGIRDHTIPQSEDLLPIVRVHYQDAARTEHSLESLQTCDHAITVSAMCDGVAGAEYGVEKLVAGVGGEIGPSALDDRNL